MKKYVNEICLPYLVPEIWLFVYICLHFEAESQIVPKHLKMVPSENFFYILSLFSAVALCCVVDSKRMLTTREVMLPLFWALNNVLGRMGQSGSLINQMFWRTVSQVRPAADTCSLLTKFWLINATFSSHAVIFGCQLVSAVSEQSF